MRISFRDVEVIRKIRRYCVEINEAHTEYNKSYVNFASNSVYRNAICLCLLQIGELANHLSDEFKETYHQIPWRAIRGMRNVVAHEYGNIDIATVWETAEDGVSDLIVFCDSILQTSSAPE